MTELPSALFPVVFSDGERDIDVGTITVNPSLDFQKFQAIISQKIGVSPHQISISLVRRKKARSSPEIRRKVPIDESSDFSAIARERDCFVLVVMRRSRRERRGRGRRGRQEIGVEKKIIDPPEKTILRRNQEFPIPPMSETIGIWDYDSQLRNLERMRERYLMSAALNYPYTAAAAAAAAMAVNGGFRPPAVAPPAAAVVCEECLRAKREGRVPAFHWCVYDKVTVGFRSPAGPIERPSKKHFEASP